jgi:hypothetical protein
VRSAASIGSENLRRPETRAEISDRGGENIDQFAIQVDEQIAAAFDIASREYNGR